MCEHQRRRGESITPLIQSRAVRVCLEDTMSVSGCPPSIGACRLGGQCPDWSGETLAKRLQRVFLKALRESYAGWRRCKRFASVYKNALAERCGGG